MGSPLKVLLVDDDPLFARGLGRELTNTGADVSIVSDLPAARHELVTRAFDVIILDYRLEDADGPSLLENWPGEKALPPVILLSGYVGIRETVRAMRAGALDVMKKPAAARDILERLRQSRTDAPPSPGEALDIDPLIGEHPAITSARRNILELAQTPHATVVIVGEPGTERLSIARLIHEATRSDQPFLQVDCGAIPEHLFDSEIWGRQPGDGASACARAGTGTLFLDDVNALPPAAEQRLVTHLRARDVGHPPGHGWACRIICATSEPVVNSTSLAAQLKRSGTAATVTLPPLRERLDDLGPITNYFLAQFATRHPGSPRRITPSALAELRQHAWPGNVQELKAVIQHSAVLCESPEIGISIVQGVLAHRNSPQESQSGTRLTPLNFRGSLPELERATILQAFRASGSNVSEAARLVGLPRSTVRDKLKKYGIR